MIRARNGEELTDAEAMRARANVMRFLVNMEWMFREMPTSSPERRYVKQNVLANKSNPFLRRVWDDRSAYFDPEFVGWVEKIFSE
jgi:hypothetical protein